MAKKRDSDPKDRKLQNEKAVSRRDFVKKGAAGVSAAVLSTSGTALAQVSPRQAVQWNYEADVVIICVPTPLTETREPDLTYVVNSAKAIAATLRRGQLVLPQHEDRRR